MSLQLGACIFAFWCLLGLLYVRSVSWTGRALYSPSDFASPVFLLVVPLLIIITNTTVIFVSSSNGAQDIVKYFILSNVVPLSMICVYSILRRKLILIKKVKDESEQNNREMIERWLKSLQKYNENMQVYFYTYSVDGELTGKIIAKYKSVETKNALIQSAEMLPLSIDLEIEPFGNDLLN